MDIQSGRNIQAGMDEPAWIEPEYRKQYYHQDHSYACHITWPGTALNMAGDINTSIPDLDIHRMLSLLPYRGRTISYHVPFKYESS